jgi:transcriptional regulator with XRE-family HTH domain
MAAMMTLANRLRAARQRAGLSQPQLAKQAGVSQQSIDRIERGLTLNPGSIVELAQALGVSATYLKGLEEEAGERSEGSTTASPVPVEAESPQEPLDIPGVQKGAAGLKSRPKTTAKGAGIPEIDVRAGMGGGGLALLDYHPDGNGGQSEADAVRGRWALPVDYLTRELHVLPNAVRIIEVQGDSMQPTLQPGDRVMVDTHDRTPSPPGIFALWDGLGTVVKRVEFIPNTDPLRFVISSDNPVHQRYERTADELNIIGRIVWYGRRM